jgi:hypothetical protein
LVHYQPRVAVYVQLSGPELDSNAEAIDEALIFGDIVRSWEVEADGVTEPISLKQD